MELRKGDGRMKCSCLKFESKEIPCVHMFRVMLIENIDRSPASCILKRWTCVATDRRASIGSSRDACMSGEFSQTARYGILASNCKKMCYYAFFMQMFIMESGN